MSPQRLRKLFEPRISAWTSPCQSTDISGRRGQRSGPCKIPEPRLGGSKMHGYRSGPRKMHEHRTGPAKMPRHRRSCKASVGAISGGVLALQLPFLKISESMGNHDSKIVDADSVD